MSERSERMKVASDALLGVESATVYRAAGRRWFTKRAACRALARKAVMARCECEPTYQWGPGSLDCTPGQTCWYHADADRYRKIIRRMARVYARTLTPNTPLWHGADIAEKEAALLRQLKDLLKVVTARRLRPDVGKGEA